MWPLYAGVSERKYPLQEKVETFDGSDALLRNCIELTRRILLDTEERNGVR